VEAAASTTSVETAASTTSVEAAASTAAMTPATMLRERCRRVNQRHRSKYCEENLETSGPKHVCDLHPTASQAVRAARSPKPFYIN
jgi:hypothetical protein